MENYCKVCGTKLILKHLDGEGEIPFCTTCNDFRFPGFNVAVSMIVRDLKTNKILLIKQYSRDRFILVAGYVNKGENEESAVVREVKEETGLDVVKMRFNRTKYFEPSNTLMCNFTAFVEDGTKINVNREIDSFAWFTEEEARTNILANSLAAEFLNKYLDEIK